MATLSRALHAQCAGLRAKKTQETVVAAAIRQATFIQPDRETAGRQVWRHVADQLHGPGSRNSAG